VIDTVKNKNVSINNRPVRLSFCEMLESVVEQTDAKFMVNTIMKTVDRQAIEFCRIITEVLVMNPAPDREMKINEEMIPLSVVQEVYRQLDFDNLELAMERFNAADRVINKKAYIRAILYNTYFETESHYAHLVKAVTGKREGA